MLHRLNNLKFDNILKTIKFCIVNGKLYSINPQTCLKQGEKDMKEIYFLSRKGQPHKW